MNKRRNLLHAKPSPLDDWKNFDCLIGEQTTIADVGTGKLTSTYVKKKVSGFDNWENELTFPENGKNNGSGNSSGTLYNQNKLLGVKVVPEEHDIYGNGKAGYAAVQWDPNNYINSVALTMFSTRRTPKKITIGSSDFSIYTNITNTNYGESNPNWLKYYYSNNNNIANGVCTQDSTYLSSPVSSFTIDPANRQNQPHYFIPTDCNQNYPNFGKIGCHPDKLVYNTSNDQNYKCVTSPFVGDYWHRSVHVNDLLPRDEWQYKTLSINTSCLALKQYGIDFHVPSILELMYFVSHLKSYNDLTTYGNYERYKYDSSYSALKNSNNYELINILPGKGLSDGGYAQVTTSYNGYFWSEYIDLLSSTVIRYNSTQGLYILGLRLYALTYTNITNTTAELILLNNGDSGYVIPFTTA